MHFILRVSLFVVLALSFSCVTEAPVFAQTNDDTSKKAPAASPEAQTNLQKFVARKGRLIVKDFGKIADIKSKYDGSLQIETLIYSAPNATAAEKAYGVRFERAAVKNYETDEVGYLDFDEAKALVETLAFIQKMSGQMKSESHENSEVDYRTRGDMKFGFVQTSTEQTCYVQVERKSIFFDMDKVQDIKTAVELAITRLTAAGAK